MKKMMCGVLCAALLACSAGAAAAGSYTVTVDGAALDLSGKTPFVSQDKVMVPLRPVAEALGYTVTYRMAEGTEDVSGDYNAYPWTAETEADGVTVTLKGQEEDAVLLAVWTDGQYSYALACSAPLTAEEATAMASGVAPLE